MKVSRRACDLCGCEIAKGQPYAVLNVPKWDAPKPTRDDASPFTVMWIGPSPDDANEKRDVCRGCCEGLLRGHHWLMEQVKEQIA